MNDVDTLLGKLDDFQKTLQYNEKASKAFLYDVGILTEDGVLTPNYEQLCILPEQD